MTKVFAFVLALATTACATQFAGAPTVPNGSQGCFARCASLGMALVGMVSMGDQYTDGCICGVPDKSSSAAMCGAVAAAPAAAGVVMQTRRSQQNQSVMGH